MLQNEKLGMGIMPIVEPVNLSSTLLSTLKTFVDRDRSVIVIENPQVGKFNAERSRKNNKERHDTYLELLKSESILKGHIINSASTIEALPPDGNLAIIMNDVDHLNRYNFLFIDQGPRYTFVPDEAAFRRRIRGSWPLVLLADRFPKMDRNKDYAIEVDNYFSSDHLYFKDEGYKGFSDYSIVGDGYSESGFLPHAVVIHMVYFGDQDELRIHHYVSDSNDDYEDPAGKFSEALHKLVMCPHFKGCDTMAMQQFRKHHENGTYPGLGVVKKLSIMHHLELMNEFLDEVVQ
jgi:hypothetical protein